VTQKGAPRHGGKRVSPLSREKDKEIENRKKLDLTNALGHTLIFPRGDGVRGVEHKKGLRMPSSKRGECKHAKKRGVFFSPSEFDSEKRPAEGGKVFTRPTGRGQFLAVQKKELLSRVPSIDHRSSDSTRYRMGGILDCGGGSNDQFLSEEKGSNGTTEKTGHVISRGGEY